MSSQDRLHALDAVRAFALLLGVAFHAGFSFIPGMIPGLWAANDVSPSTTLSVLVFTAHIFRMSLFFFVAGFFARMMLLRKGPRGFWLDRSRRILVPLLAGWPILFPAIAAVWVWGWIRTFGANAPAAPQAPPAPAGAFPLTHLWFLYYLLVLYAIVLTARAILVSLDRQGALRRRVDQVVRGAVRSGLAAPLLALPVATALYVHADWIAWFGIPTPDQSLIPGRTSLIAFGTAITFGWLVQRQTDLLQVWKVQWPFHAAAAVASTAICLAIGGSTPVFVPMAAGTSKLAFVFCYGFAVWSWGFAVIGAAMQFLSHANGKVRYVADASYWIYLLHLPLVAALQVAVSKVPLHWSLKFPFILVMSLALLFGTYHLFVRSTFIGQVLNGRRYPRTRTHAAVAIPATVSDSSSTHFSPSHAPTAPSSASAAATPTTTMPDAAPSVAALIGVHKRYGKTIALDGLDLDLREGELLALLGPNGAGKSTAVSLWLGLLEPDRGEVRLLAGSPCDLDERRQVGVMMQEVGLTPELRVRELIELTRSYYPEPLAMRDVLELTRTEELADRAYAKLSGGQKRLVQFALAICGRPSLLFLDEPTVGLDVDAREAMWRTIRAMLARGCSIVLTTHYLEEAEALASRVAVIASGRLIASGTVDGIRSLVSRKQISCISTVQEEDVKTWDDVTDVRRDATRLRITAVDAESVVRRLLAADAHLRDLEVSQASLADAFSALTNKEAA